VSGDDVKEAYSLIQERSGGATPTLPHQELCTRCKKPSDRLYPAFGKKICKDCKENRPFAGTGNSGMKDVANLGFVFEDGLYLQRVPKSDGLFGHLYFSHYPGSKGIVGRAMCYLVYNKGEAVGIIGCSSPPKNYKIFNEYFNVDEKLFVMNNVFRLIENDQNLATRVLRIFRHTIKADYKQKYGDDIVGIATFVEKPRTGVIYKADNWDLLGETEGKRMRRDPVTWEKTFVDGEKKYIFGYKYRGHR
jgi:hypothetical protein